MAFYTSADTQVPVMQHTGPSGYDAKIVNHDYKQANVSCFYDENVMHVKVTD